MVWVKRGLWAMGLLLIGMAGWLWLTMLSPWFYERPDSVAEVEPRTHQVFVYGTLRYWPVRWVVMGASGDPSEARLPGFERRGLDLSPNPAAHVEGLLLTVTADQLERLDRYERLGVRYNRIKQPLANGQQAWVYVRLPTLGQRWLAPPVDLAALVTYPTSLTTPPTPGSVLAYFRPLQERP